MADQKAQVGLLIGRATYGCGPLWRHINLDQTHSDNFIISVADTRGELERVAIELGWTTRGCKLVGLGLGGAHLKGIIRALKAIREYKLTIVQTAHFPSFFSGALAKLLFGVTWFHFEGTINARYGAARKLLCGVPSLFSNKVVCVSRAVLDSNRATDHSNLIRRDARVVIYNGIDVQGIDSAVPVPRLREDEIRVGYLGRLEPVKNLDLLIHEFHKAADSDARLSLYLVGDGSERKRLESLCVTLNIQNRVSFIGEVNRNTAYSWLKSFDIFVLPSFFEGLSSSLAQAMAAGCCIIVSDIPGNTELVVDKVNGFVTSKKGLSISEAIHELSSDPDEFSTMRAEARRAAMEKLDITSILARYKQVYGLVEGEVRD